MDCVVPVGTILKFLAGNGTIKYQNVAVPWLCAVPYLGYVLYHTLTICCTVPWLCAVPYLGYVLYNTLAM